MTDVPTRFVKEVAEHELTIAHDDGLYRHLKFRHTGTCYSGYYWFDLITAPGVLFFQGDGDGFAFRRMEDMFEFFRSSAYMGRPNVQYWAEKLAGPSPKQVMTYKPETSARRLIEDFRYYENDADRYIFPSKPADFQFGELWEVSFRDYDWWFLWSLEAILWGIGKYDEAYGRTSRYVGAMAPSVVTVELPEGPAPEPLQRSVVTVELPGGPS